ncbi:MAG: DUF4276 family protein [Oscillatoriales cyanobacterium SM2_2_1]|nr:DUF4276 family protein [Oscillatoriales cyanobacterium SM2_2_1]
MNELRYTLLGDGSSDRALMPILTWWLREHLPHLPIQGQWADLGRSPQPPKSLVDRIHRSLDLYPCDLLFIHRDAERESYESRATEINAALCQVTPPLQISPICVIPIRMTEAWLLIDEQAIREAADNPKGRKRLDMPNTDRLEDLPDPKEKLYELFRLASELKGRRLKEFQISDRVHRLADLISDFSPLRQLSAFGKLENKLQSFAQGLKF